MSDKERLLTERRNPNTLKIDQVPTLHRLRIINREDTRVAGAVEAALPQIAAAVDAVTTRLESGGRLFYIGAGTSGRLGVLDAVECPPTFGVSPDRVQALLAGGFTACHHSQEFAEDDGEQGPEDLRSRGLRTLDAVVGISASGSSPYTVRAVQYARELGSLTAGISCNPETPLSRAVELPIEVLLGPEVIAGSTRMKAGTAQKMVLNMISTAVMIGLGNVYSNLMVNLHLSSRKLVDRGVRIIAAATGISRTRAEEALKEAGDVRSAIVMIELDCTADEARGLVSQSARVSEILRDKR